MSTKVGDIFVRAGLDDRPYQKGLRGMSSSGSAVASKIGKKLAVALSVGSLVTFAKKATEAGASLNAMGTIIDASLPHMTAQVDAFAKSAGAMFGLSETQAKGFVGKFASMASAMGYTEKQAYNMSTALTGLAGDVASYYHISADDAYAKLGAVFTGETESLKQLGVVMTQSALDAFALQQGFGKTTAQMSELEKTTLRYQFVLDRLKLASGDFAKYANTWSGSIATIRLNWSNFMAQVGQGIINLLLPLLQVIAKVSNALTALGSKFLAWTRKLMGIKNPVAQTFGKQTQDALKSTGTGVDNVGKNLGNTGKQAKQAKKQVQALKRELLGFDRITKLNKESGVTTGNTGTSGGGGGISAGGIDFTEAEADISTFSQTATDYLSKIKLPPALTDALDHLKSAFSTLFDILKDAGKWAYDNVLEPLGKWTMEEGAPTVINLFATAIDTLSKALKAVGGILEPLYEPLIKPFFTFLLNLEVARLKGITTFIEGLGNVIETLGNVLKPVAEGLGNFFTMIEDSIKNPKEIKIAIADGITDKINTIKTKWDEFKKNIKDAVIGINLPTWDDVKKQWQNLMAKFKGASPKVKLTLPKWGDLKARWNKLKGKFSSINVGMKLKISTVMADIKGWINSNVIGKLNSALQGATLIGGWFKKHPIRYLAQGGYVKANTPQMAVIGDNRHEGEIVAPESKLRAMAQEASSGTDITEVVRLLSAILTAVQTKDSNVYLDGEQIKKNVVRRINNHTRATGQLEIIV